MPAASTNVCTRKQAEQSGEACWALLCRRYQASARSCCPRSTGRPRRHVARGAMASASTGDGSDHAIERRQYNSDGIEPWSTALYVRVLKVTDRWGPGGGTGLAGTDHRLVGGSDAVSSDERATDSKYGTPHDETCCTKRMLAPPNRGRRVMLAHWPPQALLALRRTLFLISSNPAHRPTRPRSTLPIRRCQPAWMGLTAALCCEARVRWAITCNSRGVPDVFCFAADPVLAVLRCSLLLMAKRSAQWLPS